MKSLIDISVNRKTFIDQPGPKFTAWLTDLWLVEFNQVVKRNSHRRPQSPWVFVTRIPPPERAWVFVTRIPISVTLIVEDGYKGSINQVGSKSLLLHKTLLEVSSKELSLGFISDLES